MCVIGVSIPTFVRVVVAVIREEVVLPVVVVDVIVISSVSLSISSGSGTEQPLPLLVFSGMPSEHYWEPGWHWWGVFFLAAILLLCLFIIG